MARIDLNADLGETVDGVATADDEAMFGVISSASIACGGHAGDDASIARAIASAEAYGVRLGAHPSYPDRAGFGRRRIDIAEPELRATLREQLDRLIAAGADLAYVKPHGALYHAVTADARVAAVVCDTVADTSVTLGRPLPIVGVAGEGVTAAAERGLPFVFEAFLDRAYTPTGALVPRTEPGAVITDPEVVALRAVGLAQRGVLTAVDGDLVEVAADTLCLHGDTAGAVAIARRVRAALEGAGVRIESPW